MDIKPVERSIRELFSAQKQYVIPRFQREYSWEKRHYNEFLLDMLGSLHIVEGLISPSPYFMGTMLFVGDADDKNQRQSLVVDGQQRLTTITILFSALSNIFSENNEQTLADKVFGYVMSADDDGNEVRVLKTVTSYPYFSYFIQSRDKQDANTPSTEEEETIKEAYEYYYSKLQEGSLRRILTSIDVDAKQISYIDILKALRDQVLMSSIIEIYTSDSSVANKLFEILNSKGKHLSFIDLIKNRIFSTVNSIEPVDFASTTWTSITELLNTGQERTGFATFFRQYWSSKYKRSTSSTIFNDFNKAIKETEYVDFLRDLKREASTYQHISNPSREIFNNRKEYYYIVQSLKTFNVPFNVIQVRVPLLALFDIKARGLIRKGRFEAIVSYLENFHFAYNSVLSKSPNRIEPIYSNFSTCLRGCSTPEDVEETIKEKLFFELDKWFPSFDEFSEGFVRLSFMKQDNPMNVKTKYALNKLNCIYQGNNLFDDRGSVEHIIPENDSLTLNIGNLILLEESLNNQAKDLSYEKKLPLYRRSGYKWVQSFADINPEWDNTKIEDRAKEMAKEYYKKVFKKPIKD